MHPSSTIPIPQPSSSKRDSPDSNSDCDHKQDSNTHNGPNAFKKRHVACKECRKRKLKCCGTKPTCTSCSKHRRVCEYSDVLKKSGPKPGYLKKLEERLEQLESILGENENSDNKNDSSDYLLNNRSSDNYTENQSLLSLGVDEPYPSHKIVAELIDIFFKQMSSYFCFVDRSQFNVSIFFRTQTIKPYLFYSVLAIAALISGQRETLQTEFYRRATKYIVRSELKGFGEEIVNIQYVQTLVILNVYDHLCAFFARGWMTGGKSVRAAQMLNLHRLDLPYYMKKSIEKDVLQCSDNLAYFNPGNNDPKNPNRNTLHGGEGDWDHSTGCTKSQNIKEARKTFWATYVLDRYGSVATGWPISLNDSEVSTLLCMDDFEGELDRPEETNFDYKGARPYQSTNQVTEDYYKKANEYKKKPIYCTLEEFLSDPAKYERGRSSFVAYTVAYGYFLRSILELINSPDREDDALPTSAWWKRNEELQQGLDRLATCIPPVDPKSSFVNFAITLNLVHNTCMTSLARVGCTKSRSIGHHNKSVAYEHTGLQYSIDLIMALRQAPNLSEVLCHPCPLYCLFTAARNFLAIIKEKADYLKAIKTPPPSGSYAAATLVYNTTILSQCRSYLDFLLTALNIIRNKFFMAQCFYEKIHLDILSADLGEDVPCTFKFTTWVNQELKKQAAKEKSNDPNADSDLSISLNSGASFKIPNITAPGMHFWRTVRQIWDARTQYTSSQPIPLRTSNNIPCSTAASDNSLANTANESSNLPPKKKQKVGGQNEDAASAGLNNTGNPNSFSVNVDSNSSTVSSSTSPESSFSTPKPYNNVPYSESYSNTEPNVSSGQHSSNTHSFPSGFEGPGAFNSHPYNSNSNPQFDVQNGVTDDYSKMNMHQTEIPSAISNNPDVTMPPLGPVHTAIPHSNAGSIPHINPVPIASANPVMTAVNPASIPPEQSVPIAYTDPATTHTMDMNGATMGSYTFPASQIQPVLSQQHMASNTMNEPPLGYVPTFSKSNLDRFETLHTFQSNSSQPVQASTEVSSDDLFLMSEFDNMVKYSQRYPEYLTWTSGLNVDGLMKDVFPKPM